MQPTPVLLPGKSCGWRSLVEDSPWGCKESGMTEWLHFHFSTHSSQFISLTDDCLSYSIHLSSVSLNIL